MLWLKKYGIALILAEVIENPLGNSKILLSGNLVNKVKTLKKGKTTKNCLFYPHIHVIYPDKDLGEGHFDVFSFEI